MYQTIIYNKKSYATPTEFKNWCTFDPFHVKNIENNKNHFITLSWKMLKFQEDLPDDTKGKKTFTLFPLKSDFVATSILINKTTMYNLIQQLKIEERHVLLQKLDSEEVQVKEALQNDKKTMPFALIQLHHEQIFKTFFNYEKFERENVKFNFSLQTNGYAVCSLFTKPQKQQ